MRRPNTGTGLPPINDLNPNGPDQFGRYLTPQGYTRAKPPEVFLRDNPGGTMGDFMNAIGEGDQTVWDERTQSYRYTGSKGENRAGYDPNLGYDPTTMHPGFSMTPPGASGPRMQAGMGSGRDPRENLPWNPGDRGYGGAPNNKPQTNTMPWRKQQTPGGAPGGQPPTGGLEPQPQGRNQPAGRKALQQAMVNSNWKF